MAKEWTDDEVQGEIRDAIRIVREDRFEKFARSTLAPKPAENEPKNGPPPSGGNNPDPNDGAPKAKKSLFWGQVDD